jgi:hypothetical protein
MMPKDQMSTFGPYSFRVTTSGAIQYGVPTIVVRFAESGSAIRAQNPKSARPGQLLQLLIMRDLATPSEPEPTRTYSA